MGIAYSKIGGYMDNKKLIDYMLAEAVINGVNYYGLEAYIEALDRVYVHNPIIKNSLKKIYKIIYKI